MPPPIDRHVDQQHGGGRLLDQPAFVEQIEQAVRNKLEEGTKEINQAIDGAELLFKNHSIESAATYDTVALEVEVGITSALGRRYFELIHKLDQLMPLLQTLEIEEVITEKQVEQQRADGTEITTYAWTGSAYVVPSAMSKAGIAAMTRSLAVAWGKTVRVNCVSPGWIRTDLAAEGEYEAFLQDPGPMVIGAMPMPAETSETARLRFQDRIKRGRDGSKK